MPNAPWYRIGFGEGLLWRSVEEKLVGQEVSSGIHSRVGRRDLSSFRQLLAQHPGGFTEPLQIIQNAGEKAIKVVHPMGIAQICDLK